MTAVIELRAITKSFAVGLPYQFTAVRDVSLVIEKGQVVVIKGPSGSGKTTLLTLIGCMARPTSGRIMLKGLSHPGLPGAAESAEVEVTSLPERFLTAIRRATFGFIFQHFNLVRGITVLENVMLPAYPTGEPYELFRSRALKLLELFSISRHATTPVDRLSGGETQRVAIARALINNPMVIIADEPTAHLDSALSAEFMEILSGFRGQGKTVLIASHDPLVYESCLPDMVVNMHDGAMAGITRRQ